MVNAHRKALERMWKDRCSVFVKAKITDPSTKLTDFQEKPLFEDQPCKLSFETLKATSGDETPVVTQVVKLFLSPDVEVPAGSKIVITRFNTLERKFTFSHSGLPGVFTDHQEILLEPFKGYA